ncbi:hypothetical protein THIOM_004261 [Candidatus Thiomargarita nelsonii]|uniref:Uncharacterized protein n=1 Tax=Candidatus Thiomargarita nelsonii TaxID=1003181 RepID=A0A176RWG1_9GAMM|nr:hypothetical protein THIOM_004261 [Candidatus Thiomargarita nelsonii]
MQGVPCTHKESFMTKTASIIWLVLCTLAFFIGYNLHPQTSESTTSTASPAKTFHWKMVTTWPPNFPIFQTGVKPLAKDLEMWLV